MTETIKKFVECTIPVSHCNLKCSYCYIIQEHRRNINMPGFKYSPEYIGRAFNKRRWGGSMLVNLCGAGETLMCPGITQIIAAILNEGHFMNVTTNGTMSKIFDEIINLPDELLSRLCFAFSLHEGKDFSIFTEHSEQEYINYGKEFKSPLFDFTCKNFRVKRHEFCYAGDWSFKLNLATGELRSCYFSQPFYNIYENVNECVKTFPVGNNCGNSYCVNSSHFMSLGVIPEIQCPSYVELRDRPEAKWYTVKMRGFLDTRLYNGNSQYSTIRKYFTNQYFRLHSLMRRVRAKVIRKINNVIKINIK